MSRITGIVAEYNPFHKGHAYHLEKARELTDADYLVVVMSGDFVQRGAPALFDKYLRTEAALLGGADLVLELPAANACASAESFAWGAVSILEQLGCVNALSFGSETGDTQALLSCAEVLLQESDVYREQLRSLLKKGYSFPAARREAVGALGLEYIKALKRAGSSIQPTALKRAGAGYHDYALTDSYSSATAVRKLIRDNDTEKRTESVHWSKLLAGAMPESSALLTARRLSAEAPVWEDDFSLLLCYQLMRLSPKELAAYSDMSPELARRIHAHLNEFHSYSQFSALLKTRELTYTRINRALLHVLLGIKAERGCPPKASYARILGFRKNAGGLLKEIKANEDMTLVTKAADYGKLLAPQSAKRFEQDLFASNLYSTVRAQKNGTAFVNDIQKSPVIL